MRHCEFRAPLGCPTPERCILAGRCMDRRRGLSVASMLSLMVVAGCNQTPLQRGQLFCAVAAGTGPIVVAVATMEGVPVIVSGLAAGQVKAVCDMIGAIPVAPPPDPAAAPVVVVPIAQPSEMGPPVKPDAGASGPGNPPNTGGKR